jgi:hypothetical protein
MNETCVSSLDWMPKHLLNDSKAFSAVVDSLIELYFPSLWANKSQTSKQVTPKSDTSLGAWEKTRGGQSRRALKRQRLDDLSASHASPHLKSTNRHFALRIPPASVAAGITIPIIQTTNEYTTHLSASNHVLMSANSTRKRQKTRDGGEFFKFLTLIVHKMTNIVIEANQPHWDGSAGLDDVPNRPQPEQYNSSGRPNTLPYEQARDAASAVSALMITSNVDADIHGSPAPQPSCQDGPEHSRPPPFSSPNSQEVIDSSASALIGGRGEGSTLAESTRQTSPLHHAYMSLDGQVINNEPVATTTTPTENVQSSTISIANSLTDEDQQHQHFENTRLVGQSRHSNLHTAFEGNHQIIPTSYPEDIEQTRHDQPRIIDPSLPSYEVDNLLLEPYEKMSYCFLQYSSP